MSWVSTMGRAILQAYSDGLVMNCPMHRCETDIASVAGPTASQPAAIDRPQDNLRAALRPEIAAALDAQAISPVRH
jgi:hypothetical protein